MLRPGLALAPDWNSYAAFARNVLDRLAEGEHPDCEPLREQVRAASFREMDYTGAGFFLSFELPEDAPRMSRSGEIGDVQGGNSAGRNPIGVVLFVRDGRIEQLEAFGYADWPTDLAAYEVRYIKWRQTSKSGATAEPVDVRDLDSFWGPNLEA